MPYVDRAARERLKMEPLPLPKHPGELNYLFTKLINSYMLTNGVSYQVINDIVGALEGAKMEFYRRVAVPYEEQKME